MYQKILVPMDGSELAECVLPHVEAIAKGCRTGEVVFIRVILNSDMTVAAGYYDFNEEERKKIKVGAKTMAEEYMNKLINKVDCGEAKVSYKLITEGSIPEVASMVAAYAEKNGVDLVAIATHGSSGISRWAWGSVADKLLRSVCVPVFMVRAPGCTVGT